MRHICVLFLILAALAVPALADDWSQTFTISATPDLRVRTSDGSIRIYSGTAGKVEASVHAVGYTRGKDYDVDVHQAGNRIDVQVRQRGRWDAFNWGIRRSIEVRIVVPQAANLDLGSGDGAVQVENVAGTVRVETGDGAIRASRVKGNVALHTGDGSVTVDGAEGSLQAHTGDGAVNARGRFDGLSLETNDGQVEVRVEDGSAMHGKWSVRTGDGSVTLALPSSFAADLDVSTGDGRIDCDFPGNLRSESNRFQSRVNKGIHLLTVRSGDGHIRIRRN